MASTRRTKSHLRSVPVQQRSADTVERILAAAMQILEQGGLSAFNTNAVSAAAKVNVGTLYHYFPDKESILRELFERTEAERLSYLRGMIGKYPGNSDTRKWVTEVVRTLVRMRKKTPGATVLRSAVRVVPELQRLEDEHDSRSARELAAVLRQRHPTITGTRAANVARMVITVGVTVLDLSGEIGSSAASVERELVELLVAYLGSLD